MIDLIKYIYIYRYGQFNSPTFSTPPQTHTSDRPIFKNSFDSENSGKLMRHYVADADFRLILCTVTNSSPWPYFWGTKNFDYIFENLIKTVSEKVPFFFGYLYFNH